MQLPGSFAANFFIICQQVIRDFLYKQPWPLPITLLLFQQSTSSLSRRSGRLIAIRTPHSNSVRSTVCQLLFPSTNPVIHPSGDISIIFGLQSRFIDSPRHYRRNSSHHLESCQDFTPSQSLLMQNFRAAQYICENVDRCIVSVTCHWWPRQIVAMET